MLGRWQIAVRPMRRLSDRLEERLDALNPRIVRAVRAAHEAYEQLGVRHVLVGGLAVGVHGHPRATKDVDFLVGPEAFQSSGTIVSFRAGVPLASEGVPIDSILAPVTHDAVLAEALADPVVVDGVPVIRPDALVLMKLAAGRRQDLADVLALLQVGAIDVPRTRALLQRADASLVAAFDGLVEESER